MNADRLLDFPVADGHFHLWHPGKLSYPWLAEDPLLLSFGDARQLQRPFLLGDYVSAFDGALDIRGGVHVEAGCADPLAEAKWIADQACTDFAIGHVARIDLAETGGEEMGQWAGTMSPAGFRMRLNADRVSDLHAEPADSCRFNAMFATLNARAATFDLSIFPDQADEACRLVARWPKIRFALNHLGWPRIATGRDSFETWRAMMRRLAAAPNLIVKVSMLWPIDGGWRLASVRPFLREALDLFGPDRLSWGSNFPIETCFGPPRQQTETLLEAFCDLSQSALEQIFRITTCQTYGLALNGVNPRNEVKHELS